MFYLFILANKYQHHTPFRWLVSRPRQTRLLEAKHSLVLFITHLIKVTGVMHGCDNQTQAVGIVRIGGRLV